LEPFLPFSSEEVKNMLGRKEASWKVVWNQDSRKLLDVHPLFRRIEVSLIEEELEKLKLNAIG
jgi:methionyl-tRNA synthetase